MPTTTTSVFFITQGPLGINPGQRFRMEHYLPLLQQKGIPYKIAPFYNQKGWQTIFTNGHLLLKILLVLRGFLYRCLNLIQIVRYKYVYIYREAAPIGPPVFEWIIAKVLAKKIIYDFDDAIWVPVTSEYNTLVKPIKFYAKVRMICKWAYKVSVGNEYLAAYARKYNVATYVIPTVVNTASGHHLIKNQSTEPVTIGWTGTFSTLQYLNQVLPALQQVEKLYNIDFIVIANKDPQLPLKHYRYIQWSAKNELHDLLQINIGIMPLTDDELAKGKCGFKAIQYMALGIPAVVSPVGVNSHIVDQGVNGFCCVTTGEWVTALSALITDAQLRQNMGSNARQKIETHYSVHATEQNFLNLFS